MLDTIAKNFSLKSHPDSEVELVGELPSEFVATYRGEALGHLASHVELPGFRKGRIPHDLLVKHVGEVAVLEEAIEHAMRDLYPALIKQYDLDPVGRPQISITKLAPGNPVGLTIRTAVFPELTLPDYKTIAAGILEDEVKEPTDEEVEKTISTILESRSTEKDAEGKPILPELTDDFAKSLGDFATVSAFKEKLRDHMKQEGARIAKDKRRAALIDAILAKTTVETPRVFVESELEKMVAQMKDDIKRFGMTFEDYLKRTNKTEEALREEMRDDAKKRAKLQLTLNAIAEKESVKISAEEIEKEASHILEHFKDADRERVHIYVESVLRNEKTLTILEEVRAK